MAEQRNTVLVRIRALPHEAEALRAEADRRGVPLSRLVLNLAADAGLVEHRGDPVEHHQRSTTGAPPDPRPDLDDRVKALEARVADLEAREGEAPTRKPARRPAATGAPAAKHPTTGVRYSREDHRRPIERAELPEGFPATGAELAAWREGRGWNRRPIADALKVSKEAVRLQEAKGDRPLSAGFALKMVAAVEAGDLADPSA